MRKRKAFLNMSSSLIYQVVAIICGLITPRLILATFGSTYNGVISSATQFLGMINVLTLGITGSTRVALYKTLANNDTHGTSRLIKATDIYMRKVAGGVVIYALLLSLLYPMFSHNELTAVQNASLIAVVSIGTFAEYFFGITNRTLLQADQASYISYTSDILQTICNTICVAILIKLNCSIYIVKLGSSLVFLMTPAIVSLYIHKKYSIDRKCEPDNTGIKNRGAVAFHSIANIIHQNVDLVVLTIFTDAKLISVYTVYYLVIGKIRNLMMVFTAGMEAAFGDMWVKKEMESLQNNFKSFEYLLFTFATVVFSCVGVLILPFIALYTKGVTDVNYIRTELAILITVAEAMYCIRQPYLTLVYATGSYDQTKKGAAIEAVMNIVLSLTLVNFIGIAGVIVGTFFANLFRTTQFSIYVSKNILQRNIAVVIKRVVWVIINSVLIVGASLIIQHSVAFSETWWGWIMQAAIVFIIACIITVITSLVCYRDDFKRLLNTGLAVFKKK